jgi:hypothetical protein
LSRALGSCQRRWDLLQGVETALEQLRVLKLGVGEVPRHVMKVRWIIWVRPSAAKPDLKAEIIYFTGAELVFRSPHE